MDSTALVTFLVHIPIEVRTVELLGSWDNFTRPYGMTRDPVKGHGHWTGCHSFDDIVFDGDRPDWSRPRAGALKQGGRYWYYYRLDDRDEFYDPTQPQDAGCPLLPGQLVNILDMPTELIERPGRAFSASAEVPFMKATAMTWEPRDRYQKPYPKFPTKLPRMYTSTEALVSTTQDGQNADTGLFDQEGTKSSAVPSDSVRKAMHMTSFRESALQPFAPLNTPCSMSSRPTSSRGSVSDSASICRSSRYRSRPSSVEGPATIEYREGLGIVVPPAANAENSNDDLHTSVVSESEETVLKVTQDPTRTDTTEIDTRHVGSYLDTPTFDLCSPTFSSDTLSSFDLASPPNRPLSHMLNEHIDWNVHHRDSLTDVATRLGHLRADSGSDMDLDLDKPLPPLPSNRQSYSRSISELSRSNLLALQHLEYASSDVTLKQIPSLQPEPKLGDCNRPSILGSEVDVDHSSLAQAIFGELAWM